MSTENPSLHVDRFRAGHRLCRHRHAKAYVALVVKGEYVETSLDGRFACPTGSLVIHPPFHEHANEFGAAPCMVLNLPIPGPDADLWGYRLAQSPDPGALFDLAHADARAAGRAALEELDSAAPIAPPEWLSCFLRLLMEDWPAGAAARACGVTPEHASRAAARWFGTAPCRLRRENRIRRALAALRDGASPAEAAIDAGFSDQPHLTRVLKAATGLTPGELRNL